MDGRAKIIAWGDAPDRRLDGLFGGKGNTDELQ